MKPKNQNIARSKNPRSEIPYQTAHASRHIHSNRLDVARKRHYYLVEPGRNLYYVPALFSVPHMGNFKYFFQMQYANWVILNTPITFCFDLISITTFLEVFTYRYVICFTSLQWTM
jgi:hypothetical protein